MTFVGFFSEMDVTMANNGSINEFITDKVDYDKARIINYLLSFGRQAVCPRNAIDCVTGKTISTSFAINDDGEYCWPDFLAYHIDHYSIKLPENFVQHILSKTTFANS